MSSPDLGFPEFENLHLRDFSFKAQLSKSVASTIPPHPLKLLRVACFFRVSKYPLIYSTINCVFCPIKLKTFYFTDNTTKEGIILSFSGGFCTTDRYIQLLCCSCQEKCDRLHTTTNADNISNSYQNPI